MPSQPEISLAIITGCGCQLWPFTGTGVEWSPVTTSTSGCAAMALTEEKNIFLRAMRR